MFDDIVKKKGENYLKKYSLFESNIEKIISFQELYDNKKKNNYEETIINSNKNIFQKFDKELKELTKIKSLSFWIYNNDCENFKFITISGKDFKFEIIKNNNNLTIIKNETYINTCLTINNYNFFVINLEQNEIFCNKEKIIFKDDENNSKLLLSNQNVINRIKIVFPEDNDISDNIFNYTDELIFFKDKLNMKEIEYFYGMHISRLQISNYDNTNNLKKINDIEEILQILKSNYGSVNIINEIKNKFNNTINKIDVVNVEGFEKFTDTIRKHSNLISKIINKKILIKDDEYIQRISTSLQIILDCHKEIKSSFDTLQNASFIEVSNELINLTDKINKLNSYNIVEKYIDKNDNDKVYDISDKLNFFILYEESLHYFYHGLPKITFNINNNIYVKCYSNDNLLIKKNDYLNLFSLDNDITDKINKTINSIDNNNFYIDNDKINQINDKMKVFELSNNKLDSLLNFAKNNFE